MYYYWNFTGGTSGYFVENDRDSLSSRRSLIRKWFSCYLWSSCTARRTEISAPHPEQHDSRRQEGAPIATPTLISQEITDSIPYHCSLQYFTPTHFSLAKYKTDIIMPPKRVKKVMTVPINVIFGHLQVSRKTCSLCTNVSLNEGLSLTIAIVHLALSRFRKKQEFEFGSSKTPKHK